MHTTHYRYDANGERIIKCSELGEIEYISANYVVRNNKIVSQHIFAGNQRIITKVGEKGSNGKVTNQLTLYYHPDHLSSSSYVTDGEGKFYEAIEYLPYGETLYDENVTESVGYKYTGKEQDAETGLYYYGARYYDSKVGRFISADAVLEMYLGGEGNGGGMFNSINMNLYAYASNNPIIFNDPDGNTSSTGEMYRNDDRDYITAYNSETKSHDKLTTEGSALKAEVDSNAELAKRAPQENLSYNDQVMPIPNECGEKAIGSPAGERGAIEGVIGPNFHAGQDYKTPVGTPYLATEDGEVLGTRFKTSNDKTTNEGNFIKIQYGDTTSTGMHLSQIFVSKGDKVSKGQVIGLTGNSGLWTSGPHLHEGRTQSKNSNKVWSVKQNAWIDRKYYNEKTKSFILSK